MDIKTSCLGVLALRPASGYEIRKAFEEGPFSHFAEGGFGSIYPALSKLTGEGLVTFEVEAQEKRPDKKIYQITDAGRATLVEKLCEKAPDDDKYKSDLLFILFFAGQLPADRIRNVIDDRIAFYQAKLDHLSECGGAGEGSAPDLVRGFGVTVYSAAMSYLQDHRQDFIKLADDNRPAADAAD
ncbi:PadR family transcriptional regulator [Hwanghaeella grinnelliae]|uniref:PadR family transcriptional regulator n=1 Tax=Hwanghaeella grinnelliae TaxID=2500179 RepID=A0A3S2Z5Q9_9PROT|nr:PadR family transcriptional regulator [Hwanghaeella grinnelliae]RVU34714.1 PadR family transcriptional regulator [Hwanghaeella grinnelliae]